MASTYTPIATTTLGSAQASYTFSSISGSYTDIILVINGTASATIHCQLQFNSDTNTNYSNTYLLGNGSNALSARDTSLTAMYLDTNGFTVDQSMGVWSIMNYANTTTYKTMVGRYSSSTRSAEAIVGLWRSTAAINSIKVLTTSSTLATGTTLTLYGIAAA